MTAEDGVQAARAFPHATIVPLHFEGWDHFTEPRSEVEFAFNAEQIQERLRWLKPGIATLLENAIGRQQGRIASTD